MRIHLWVLALVIAGGCATSTPPFLPPNSQQKPLRAHTVFYENDTFHGSDDAYTSGVRYSQLEQGRPPWWASRLMKHVDPKPYEVSFGWTFGQQFYTPYSITETNRIEADRPYAGWLFLGLIAQAQLEETSRHYLELNLGVAGPSARGESTQDFIHEYIVPCAPEPEGWRFQVRDEGGGMLQYRYDRRVVRARSLLDVDGTFHGGFVVGNIFTYVNGGATLRAGLNLRSFTPGKMPSFLGPEDTENGRNNSFTVYVFVRPEWRGVGHNLLLEGNHPESRNVTGRRNVVDIDKGIGIGGRRWELTLAIVQRSPEYTTQKRGQSFISAQLTVMTRR